MPALDLRDDERRAGRVEPRIRLPERAAGAALGLRPADRPQAIRLPERHALRRRPGFRFSHPEASHDPFRALRHPYRPGASTPNGSRCLERGRSLRGRRQDCALQVPEARPGDRPDPGRTGAVELGSAPGHVRARVVLSERTAAVPRPLAPERQLRPTAVRPRQRPPQPDEARRARREDERPGGERGRDPRRIVAVHAVLEARRRDLRPRAQPAHGARALHRPPAARRRRHSRRDRPDALPGRAPPLSH